MFDTIEEAIETLEGFISEATDAQVHVMVAIICGIDYENQKLDQQTYVDMLWGTIHAMSYADMCVAIETLRKHSEFLNPKIKQLIADWEACTKIKVFEMPVVVKSTGEKDWVTWYISHNKDMLIASASEDCLPLETVEWDDCFSVDVHLQTLNEQCNMAIIECDEYDHDYDAE